MMATCKECLHQCYTDDLASTEESCNFFLDKTKYVEQKHGRWEEASDGDGVVCSVCGEDFCNIYLETDRFNYCPNCGAKMECE